jgi:hypothetical protein
MKKIFLYCFLVLGVYAAKAQDDLLGGLVKEDAAVVKQNITSATFKSTRIINMQSVEMTGAGNLQFMISHHFGQIWQNGAGWKNAAQMFGLNAGVANTYLAVDYSPNKWLNLGVASTGNSQFEGWAKFKILRQQTGKKNIPVTVAWFSSFHADASDGPSINDNAWNRFSYLNQLLVARKFNDNFSLQVMGSLIHNNLNNYGVNNTNNTFSVGFGGRYKLTRKSAFTLEYSRQLNNYKNLIDETGSVYSYKPDLLSLGYDWDTGGHIFQFFISNTSMASNFTQLSANTSKLTAFALGFNLNRSFGIKKVVKVAP